FTATRYHSLAVLAGTVPPELQDTATTAGGLIMALSHRELPLHGVQVHPESVLTERGHRLLANWLAITGDDGAVARSHGRAPLILGEPTAVCPLAGGSQPVRTAPRSALAVAAVPFTVVAAITAVLVVTVVPGTAGDHHGD